MNSVSIYGRGSLTTGGALASSIVGLGYMPQSHANPIRGLSHTHTPPLSIAPAIQELSESEPTQSVSIDDQSGTENTQPVYTQKQIECAEKLGIDPSECTDKEMYKNQLSEKQTVKYKKQSTWSPSVFTTEDTLEDKPLKGIKVEERDKIIESTISLVITVLIIIIAAIGVCICGYFCCYKIQTSGEERELIAQRNLNALRNLNNEPNI